MVLKEWVEAYWPGTITSLAKRLGITTMSLYRYMSGKRIPPLKVALKIKQISKGLVTPEDFLCPKDSLNNHEKNSEDSLNNHCPFIECSVNIHEKSNQYSMNSHERINENSTNSHNQ